MVGPELHFEAVISSSVRMMRTLTGTDISPRQVTFSYPTPESVAEYERVFRCRCSSNKKKPP